MKQKNQEMHLYEYATIRFLPLVEREEFINIGVILFSKQTGYIRIKYQVNEERIKNFSTIENLDLSKIYSMLHAFELISQGNRKGGKIAQLSVPERFRWLTSVRSTTIQTSRPHPGFSENLEKTLDVLFSELVL
ncbi:DUF3037 domain-containing protein [Apibacter raozihei]|uniref:DUF3037 domain-containing protein n=2 Tax=Apibacter raozihei TaxID=2500547 RepID=UPI000FE2EF5E|nr:DUF3037 domain-containing protein [Apibacter raozihei]